MTTDKNETNASQVSLNEADYIALLKKTKKKIKTDLINLPFEEKIRRVVEMQKFSRDFSKNKYRKIYVWEL